MSEHQRAEWPPELLNARVQFWTCLNKDHRTVTWTGNVAACDTCGLTSEMTRRFAEGVAAYVREKAPDWPATRKAIDTSIARARREITDATGNALYDLGNAGKTAAALILGAVQDCLDDIDQTIPPEEDDEAE